MPPTAAVQERYNQDLGYVQGMSDLAAPLL